MTEKICTRFKKSLSLDQFGVNNKTGQLNTLCISCLEKKKCIHGKQRPRCKICGGSQICEHDKRKSLCKICKGSQICEHLREKSRCKICGGSSICKHDRRKSACKECDPQGHLASVVRSQVKKALKHDKEMTSTEYLGCDIKTFKAHIEAQFKEGMTWENHGEWHIDHKIPLKYKHNGETPSLEEVAKRLHYTNTQPMWASENIAKGNRYVS